MLLAVTYTARNPTEETQKRSLRLFTNWTPPSALNFRAHYAFTEGGIAIVETDTATALIEAISLFAPFFEFKTIPVMDIMEAVPVLQRVNNWRDSVR